jgi:DNA processing protein
VNEGIELLTLALLPEVGPRAARDLLARGPLAHSLARPDEHADLLSPAARASLRRGEARRRAEGEARRARARGIRIVGLGEADYPERLSQIYAPPAVLYVRGRLVPGEGARSVAVVGARAASPPGRALARGLARDLASARATIVSGLARGIDTEAHRGALDAGGRTVAVLGSGLDRIYPPENEGLAEAVAKGGAVVSEFPLGSAPRPENFPRRNRVIAGWGRAVVVVEAGERSGALGTARAALDEGRDVMAVPGHPAQPLAAGTNALLRDGATLVRGAADVAQEIGLVMPVTEGRARIADDVLDAMREDTPLSLEELQTRCGRSLPDLLARLAVLEMDARVRRLPGPLFVRELRA